MKKLIFQVAVGKPSKLYEHCIESVASYATRIGATHYVLRQPEYRIAPDPFNMGRSRESFEKYGGYLPIFEKEVAFDYLDNYDKIAIIDADIYIRPEAKDIFLEMDCNCAFGAVFEREMDILPWYQNKILNYSHMQYGQLHSNRTDFKPNKFGFEFANMGMILINSKLFKPFLKGQTGKQFIQRAEFKNFVDGVGAWKWSTDQTLLNYFLKKYNVPTFHLNPRYNGLFSAVKDIKECDFVHFFLKDKLPNKGEDVESLMEQI